MTLVQIINAVRHHCRLPEDTETKAQIISFVNEAIQEFARIDEWDKLCASKVLTLDDSGSYDLDVELTSDPQLESIIDIIPESGILARKEYMNYLKGDSKEGQWALSGTNLYIEGTGTTVTILYITVGYPYPLINNIDETLPIKYYSDIIIRWAIFYMLNSIGDPMADKEEKILSQKITFLKQKEQRVRKNGKVKNIVR